MSKTGSKGRVARPKTQPPLKMLVGWGFWRPGTGVMLFAQRREAVRWRRKATPFHRADGPVQRMTSVSSKHQVALTRGIARKQEIDTMLNLLTRLGTTTSSALVFKKTLLETLQIHRSRIAFEEGLTEDGQPL